MKSVTSLDELATLATTATIYVRWEVRGQAGIKRGYSINHVTGAREDGISANALMLDNAEWLATSVLEYRGVCGLNGWVITGDEIGRGSDNEPLLANVTVLAKIGDTLVAEADQKIAERWARQDAQLGWKWTT